ncbi:MAG: hypothetical protein LC808_09500 [Actinobacteria bacterium]|nr:hypothetical protein [Actinomycetota bacterium]
MGGRNAARRPHQLRKLFRTTPERESQSAIGHERYDLISYSENVVVELKLAATTATLHQLDRYLASLQADRGGRWAGHIVYGNSCSPQVITAVKSRKSRCGAATLAQGSKSRLEQAAGNTDTDQTVTRQGKVCRR